MKHTKLPNLSDRTIFEKMLFVLQIIICVLVIIAAILELTNVWNSANEVSQPLLGCMFFVLFLEYRKYNTIQAYFSLVISIIIISIFILEFCNILG